MIHSLNLDLRNRRFGRIVCLVIRHIHSIYNFFYLKFCCCLLFLLWHKTFCKGLHIKNSKLDSPKPTIRDGTLALSAIVWLNNIESQ